MRTNRASIFTATSVFIMAGFVNSEINYKDR